MLLLEILMTEIRISMFIPGCNAFPKSRSKFKSRPVCSVFQSFYFIYIFLFVTVGVLYAMHLFLWFCVLLYVPSIFLPPWSVWVAPLCCVYLLWLWFHTSHQCFSLPWFPLQSCVTSSRNTSELHHGKNIDLCHSGYWNIFCSAWWQNCEGSLFLQLVLSKALSYLKVSKIHPSKIFCSTSAFCLQLFEPSLGGRSRSLSMMKVSLSSHDTREVSMQPSNI